MQPKVLMPLDTMGNLFFQVDLLVHPPTLLKEADSNSLIQLVMKTVKLDQKNKKELYRQKDLVHPKLKIKELLRQLILEKNQLIKRLLVMQRVSSIK